MKRLSVIFCTYNREKYIYNAVKSVLEQDYDVDKYETIIINNNSTDDTQLIVKQIITDFPQHTIRHMIETNQGLSYAKNRGIKESTGEVLVFVDDDATVFEKNYLASIDNFFATYPKAGACGGPIVPIYEVEKPKWLTKYTEALLGGALHEGDELKPFTKGKYPGGGNSAFRKEIFDTYGLFNVELGRKGTGLIGAEEKDLYDRLRKGNVQFYYIPQMGLYHYIPAKKLSEAHFKELTYSIGQSERIRTKSVSQSEYKKRILGELKKWVGTLALFAYYILSLCPSKGWKLIQFRWNVSKGLLGK